MRILFIIKEKTPHPLVMMISLINGLCAGLVIYLSLFQRHFFSYRYLAYALLITIVVFVLSAFLISKFLQKTWFSQPIKNRILLIIATSLLAVMLIPNLVDQVPLPYFLLPDKSLEIRIPTNEPPSPRPEVQFLWLKTDLGFVNFSSLSTTDNWVKGGDGLALPSSNIGEIIWKGKVGYSSIIAFSRTLEPVFIQVIWDGESSLVNLSLHPDEIHEIENKFHIPLTYQLPFLFSLFISLVWILTASALLLSAKPQTHPIQNSRPGLSWLIYASPMLIVWGVTLLVFWPGMMNPDSLSQWRQAVSMKFADWHPVFHTLLISVLIRIWNTPAVVAIAQIFFLAITVAWGLKALEESGVPRAALWTLSIGFALFPTNSVIAVTLWKDVANAIAVFWLTIILLKIWQTNGAYISKPHRWLILGIAGFFTSIFRQNGIPVAIGTLALLPIFYRAQWRPLAGGLITAVLILVGVKGPIYGLLDVSRRQSGQFDILLLHHIAAHVDHGTGLTPQENDYLGALKPIDDWIYDCCYVGTISLPTTGFNRSIYLENSQQNRKVAWHLFTRAPMVNLRHMLCAGDLTWKFRNLQCYAKSSHTISHWEAGKENWISRNSIPIQENSILPKLVQPYLGWLRLFGFEYSQLAFFMLPAFFLYLLILILIVQSLRSNNFRVWLIGVPVFIQSVVLFLVSFSPGYRYQYGTVLVGLLSIGLLFIPAKKRILE